MNPDAIPSLRGLRYLVWLAAISLLLSACNIAGSDTFGPELTGQAVDDGAHGGLEGFYFLPPMVKQPAFSGDFDAELSRRRDLRGP